jgi:hypothetical protein
VVDRTRRGHHRADGGRAWQQGLDSPSQPVPRKSLHEAGRIGSNRSHPEPPRMSPLQSEQPRRPVCSLHLFIGRIVV